jgi:PAS domain S-box-containing protein
LLSIGRVWGGNSEYLIENWLAKEGLPENSALAVAQTPDGYLWVGSAGGLFRFNGIDFTRASQISDVTRLNGVVTSLHSDRSGRLWAGTDAGLALYDQGVWRRIQGTNVSLRTVAQDASGHMFIGGFEGQLWTVRNDTLEPLQPPDGLQPSGVFCLVDRQDGTIWLANRGFIGHLTAQGWTRLGPSAGTLSHSLVATSARGGGIWVYHKNELELYHADGKVTTFRAPEVDQPRELLEDSFGGIWIASNSRGLTRFKPGGRAISITSANGLAHNSIWCILEDKELNIWAGGSIAGLNRLKARQFVTIGMADGLPDNIVRSITESSPGQILVGTHGGGSARIQDGKVVWVRPPMADRRSLYSWSLLRDKSGRLWTGTYRSGLLVEENGIERSFPLPSDLGLTIHSLMEDSRGRIWVGAFSGLGFIQGEAVLACPTNSMIAGRCITCIAEDPRSGAIYAGSYNRGVFRLENGDFTRMTNLSGIPGMRISSLTMDRDGSLWVGIFDHGLACLHDGIVTLVGRPQGLPADTVGSILDDRLGWYWLGSNQGILRVSHDELYRVVKGLAKRASFNVFNGNDGLESDYCVEGYQPNATRDASGHLWFGTGKGVVEVDPARLRLNTNPPPVLVERIGYTESSGTNRLLFPSSTNKVAIPAGSVELQFSFNVLSYTAPEKVRLAYRLEGAGGRWVDIGDRRELHFRTLAPRTYRLHVKAANNDGVWSETEAALAFRVLPFVWQTIWFRILGVVFIAIVGGVTAWRLTNYRFKQRIEQLQQQRAFEQERARLATIMEATSDLVAFADGQGVVLHINPAGKKLLGLGADDDLRGLRLAQLQPRWAADRVANEGIPAAQQQGTWESETALLHRDGHEIPVSQVVVAHKDREGRTSFFSTIARDITEHKKAEADLQRREERFRSLIENASDLITVMNPEAVITFQSPSSERVLGFKPAEMVGHSLMEFVHPEDQAKARQNLRNVLANPDGSVTAAARFKHSDGTWRLLEAAGRILPGELEGRQLILNTRDITESKKLEEQFRQAQKMEAVGLLAGGVAHDFNNILAASLLQLGLLQEDPKLTPEMRSALKDLERGSNRAASLTRQLLVFSRRQVMEIKPLDFNGLLSGLLRMLKRLLGEHIDLILHGQSEPAWVDADVGMMEQVVTNLCINARDAMPNGGQLTIGTAKVEFDAVTAKAHAEGKPGSFVCLSVADTGCGMNEATLKQLFQPFFTTKEPGKGTGLGLATVFGIVKQHRGWIEVQSEIGVGSVFHVFLPAREAAESLHTSSVALPFSGGQETILVVEDNESLRMLTAQWLKRLGYQVLEAANGREALELWNQQGGNVALLLTDIVMPGGMSGLELAERLRGMNTSLKVIISSGYSLEIARRSLLKERGVAYLAKPYEGAALATLIRQCLEGA